MNTKVLSDGKNSAAAAAAEKPRAGAVKPLPDDALIVIPLRNTMRKMSLVCAPSDIRMPISCARSLTE